MHRDLRDILETDIPQEEQWWAKAEARVLQEKKRKRLEKKAATQAASQSLARSQEDSQSRQATIEVIYCRMASQAVEDNEQPEIVLDPDLAQEIMDIDE